MQSANDERSAAIVLILREDGSVGGSGFLASESGLVATCSHVVQEPRLQERGDPPPASVRVVFHSTGMDRASRVAVEAELVTEWWRPAASEDVAVLRVAAVPDGVHPARLGGSGGTTDHVVRSFGFPETGQIEGIPGLGQIIGDTEHAGRRLLVGRSPEITTGFSGGLIWDDARRRVIGMVTLISEPDSHARQEETFFGTTSETLREICPELELSDVAPYRDLEAFDEPDQEFFCGRQALIDELTDRLRSNSRFLAVLGPTGSGKSSVVRAGLVPALKLGAVPGSDGWSIAVLRPFNDPLAQLGQTAIGPVKSLDAAVARALELGSTRLALIIDQAEELFTQTPEASARAFLAEVGGILDGRPVTVVLTMRSDFYSRLGEYAPPMLHFLEGGLLNTDATLDEDQLTAIVREPAAKVGLAFAPGLVEAIVGDAVGASTDGQGRRRTGSTILPLLEFALTRLWEQRLDGDLTHEAYRRLGGITGALTQWADDTYAGLQDAEKPIAERIFVDLVHFGDPRLGIPDTRRRRLADELALGQADRSGVAQVVDRFVERRLLTTSGGVKGERLTVEIIHDALLRRWGALAGWVAKERLFRTWLQAIQDQLDEWSTNDAAGRREQAESVVLRGPQLNDAERWTTERGAVMSPDLRAFIDASRVVTRKEIRRTRERKVAFAALALVIAGLAGLGVVTRVQEETARAGARGPMTPLPAGAADLGGERQAVTLAAFSIDQHEVGAGQYHLCVRQGRCSQAKAFPEGAQADPRLPAVDITAIEAARFCEWLGRRLPTFAEWERAVRGTTYRAWPWGGAPPGPDRVNALFGPAIGGRQPGLVPIDDPSFDAGATEDGIRDLLGNAREWTTTPTDCDPYTCQREWTTRRRPPAALMVVGLSATDRFGSEGAFLAFDPFPAKPDYSDDMTGFRCASN